MFGYVSIDSIAGPSEILVLADETANPRYVAADLLSLSLIHILAKKPDLKVDPEQDQILFDHRPVIYEKYSYYLFHKPAGCVTDRF